MFSRNFTRLNKKINIFSITQEPNGEIHLMSSFMVGFLPKHNDLTKNHFRFINFPTSIQLNNARLSRLLILVKDGDKNNAKWKVSPGAILHLHHRADCPVKGAFTNLLCFFHCTEQTLLLIRNSWRFEARKVNSSEDVIHVDLSFKYANSSRSGILTGRIIKQV